MKTSKVDVCVSALLTVSEEVRSRCSLKHRKSLLLSEVTMENFPMDTFTVFETEPGCRWELFFSSNRFGFSRFLSKIHLPFQPHCIDFVLLILTLWSVRLLRENQPWASPKVSERSLAPPYSAMGQTSLRPRKSMSVDMGQPSQANAKKLLGMSGLWLHPFKVVFEHAPALLYLHICVFLCSF